MPPRPRRRKQGKFQQGMISSSFFSSEHGISKEQASMVQIDATAVLQKLELGFFFSPAAARAGPPGRSNNLQTISRMSLRLRMSLSSRPAGSSRSRRSRPRRAQALGGGRG